MSALTYRQMHLSIPKDVSDLQELVVQSTDFYLLTEGKPPEPNQSVELLRELPPGKAAEDKYFFGISLSDQLIGCIDLIRGYPKPQVAFIGLLLFIESERSKSYGSQALKYIKALSWEWGCTHLRAAVVETNVRASAFWLREGFLEIGRRKSRRYSDSVLLLEHAL